MPFKKSTSPKKLQQICLKTTAVKGPATAPGHSPIAPGSANIPGSAMAFENAAFAEPSLALANGYSGLRSGFVWCWNNLYSSIFIWHWVKIWGTGPTTFQIFASQGRSPLPWFLWLHGSISRLRGIALGPKCFGIRSWVVSQINTNIEAAAGAMNKINL